MMHAMMAADRDAFGDTLSSMGVSMPSVNSYALSSESEASDGVPSIAFGAVFFVIAMHTIFHTPATPMPIHIAKA